jgi:long-chain fatty acid transport protein
VFDWLSVGGGVSAQWVDAKLSNAIDFGSVCFAVLGPALCPLFHLSPQHADGRARLTANDWGFGYNGGVLLSPTANTRIGVAYRSHMDFDLNGDARFSLPIEATLLTAGGTVFRDTGIRANLSEPETVTFGVYQKLAPRWVGLFGAEWTRWSRVRELRIRFDNPLQPDSVLPADWHDTWFYSVGANYLYSDRLTLRAGVAYDQSPVPTSTRTPRLPGSNAIDFALGAGYKPYDDVQIDVAYQLGLLDQADIALTDPIAGSLNGHYDFTTHVFSLQVRKQF